MGIFLDAINKSVDRLCTFKIKRGRLPYHASDEEVYKILSFIGKGKQKKFSEVLDDYLAIEEIIVDCILADEKPPEHLTLYNYIVKNDYQLIFEPDDITLRHPNKAA